MAEDKQLSQQRKEVVEKITNWFQKEGYLIKPETTNDKSYYYAAVYHQTNTTRIFVDIPKDSLDKINVGTIFGYKLLEKPSYFSSDANSSNRYANAICNALQSINVQYEMGQEVEDVEIKIWKTIYFDGLSKHTLFETRGDVLAAYRSLHLLSIQFSKKSEHT